MQEIMATVSSAAVTSINFLTSVLNFIGKCEPLSNLVRHWEVLHDQIDQIQTYMPCIRTLTLRHNNIVHSVLVEGKPPNSSGRCG